LRYGLALDGLALGRRDADQHRRNDEDGFHRTLLHAGTPDNAQAAKMENEI
jgi:hypothetical protein